MGKNHRHKKNLKAERSKVQIKTKTKFLPKGQNLTDTTFKVKSIVLQEQLKQQGSQSCMTKRKVPIQELINRLKHFNGSIKSEACQELKDVIKNQPVVSFQIYMSAIVQNASMLLQDKERTVRRTSIKLIEQILESVPLAMLQPFFTYMLSNLKCAMTNIRRNIQEDSLLVFDAFLAHQPSFLASNFQSYFSAFLSLISKLRSQSGLARTLTIDLSAKVSNVKWRIKVLTCLYRILSVITKTCSKENEKIALKNLSASENNFFPVFEDASMYEVPPTELLKNGREEKKAVDISINSLIPLLFESWLEVAPEKSRKDIDLKQPVLLSEETFAIFSCTVKVLTLVREYAAIIDEDFYTEETNNFLSHLLANFPYSCHGRGKSDIIKEFAKTLSINIDKNCVEENLTIIHLCISTSNDKYSNKNNTIMMAYMVHCFKNPSSISAGNSNHFLKVLRHVLLEQPYILQKRVAEEFIDNINQFLKVCKLPENLRTAILEILTKSRLAQLVDHEWLEKLPKLLIATCVSAKLVDVILNLSIQNCSSVQQGMRKHLKDILSNLHQLQFMDVGDEEDTKRRLAHIFFYLPQLNEEELNFIKKFIDNNPSSDYAKHFHNILHVRTLQHT